MRRHNSKENLQIHTMTERRHLFIDFPDVEQQPQLIQRDKELIRNFPMASLFLFFALWGFFVGGVLTTYPDPAKANWSSVVSPTDEDWWFYRTLPWPSCEDVRNQVWRLMSMQFVHSGVLHVLTNSFCALFYGAMIEIYFPYAHLCVMILYLSALVTGTLAFSVLYPYQGLVGASPGVYGLLGACVAMVIAHRSYLDPVVLFIAPPVLLVHVSLDVAMYFMQYNQGTAYAAHLFGWVTGLLLGLCILCSKPSSGRYARQATVVMALCYLTLLVYVLSMYGLYFPAHIYPRSYTHQDGRRSCCYGYLQYLQQHEGQGERAEAEQMGSCRNDIFYPSATSFHDV